MFVHGNSYLDRKKAALKKKKQWMELLALAQVFDMQSLFLFALEGLKGCKNRNHSSSSSSSSRSRKGRSRRSPGLEQAKRFWRRLIRREGRDPVEFAEFSGLSEFYAWE